MFIVPIQSIDTLAELQKQAAPAAGAAPAGLPFQSIFEDAIQNVKETSANVDQEIYKLSTGQIDDVHNLVIASSKATASVQLLVQLREQALTAYNELMRMNV